MSFVPFVAIVISGSWLRAPGYGLPATGSWLLAGVFTRPPHCTYHKPMIDEPSRIRARQKTLRALMLLVILGLGTAIAWSLSRHRGAKFREAVDIIAGIRSRGLSSFWTGEQGKKQWFLSRNRGKVVGWKFTFHKPTASGGFEGGMVVIRYAPTGTITHHASSRWTLSGDIRQGLYTAREILIQPGRSGLHELKFMTRTELKNGGLSINQRFGLTVMDSSAAAPENYLPEGTEALVLQQVARRKTSAIFASIVDSEPPEQNRPRFTKRIAKYLGPDEEDPRLSVLRIEQKLSGRSYPLEFCFYDSDGRLVKQTFGATEIHTVTRKEILAFYPQAEAQVKRLLKPE